MRIEVTAGNLLFVQRKCCTSQQSGKASQQDDIVTSEPQWVEHNSQFAGKWMYCVGV